MCKSIDERFPYLEFPYPGISTLSKAPGSRLIKTHVAPSLLRLTDGETKAPKLLTIVRDGRDVLVSYYYFARMNNLIGYGGTFDQFFDSFVTDKVPYAPMLKLYDEMDAMSQDADLRDRILIIRYEDLKSDFGVQVDRLCQFLGKSNLNPDQMEELKRHCSFDQMRLNPSVNYGHWKEFGLAKPDEAPFLRKGQVGDWKQHFTVEQEKGFQSFLKPDSK